MANCKNCFSNIDMRSVKYCSKCSSPLHKDCAINDGGTLHCDVCFTVKKESGENKNYDIPNVIRRSYIDVYKECPYKFYMEVIKGKERPENIYSKVGVDLHNLFDKASNNKEYKQDKMISDFKELWDNYSHNLFESKEQKDKMYKRAIFCINTFYEILTQLPDSPFSTEEYMKFDVGENLPKISVTSDRIDKINEQLEVIDWKTGNIIVGKQISSDLQAPLYIYAIQSTYDIPINKFTFYYLNSNKKRVFERVDKNNFVCKVRKREYYINLLNSIKEVQGIFSQIKKGNFTIPSDMKKMYYTCKICHLFNQRNCQGSEIEGWKQINQK